MSGWNRWNSATASKTCEPRVQLGQGWAGFNSGTLPIPVRVPPSSTESHRAPEPPYPSQGKPCSAAIPTTILMNHSGGA